jgi:hypothetical protein
MNNFDLDAACKAWFLIKKVQTLLLPARDSGLLMLTPGMQCTQVL